MDILGLGEKKSILDFTKSMVETGLTPSTSVLVNVCAYSLLECVCVCMCGYRICRKDPSSSSLRLSQRDPESLHLSMPHYVSQHSYMSIV